MTIQSIPALAEPRFGRRIKAAELPELQKHIQAVYGNDAAELATQDNSFIRKKVRIPVLGHLWRGIMNVIDVFRMGKQITKGDTVFSFVEFPSAEKRDARVQLDARLAPAITWAQQGTTSHFKDRKFKTASVPDTTGILNVTYRLIDSDRFNKPEPEDLQAADS